MGQYSKEEIKVFEDKELRIVRQAILKKLIEKCKLEDVYGVDKVVELMDKYVDYVYKERSTKGGNTEPAINWDWEAQGLNLAIPNSQNIKILNLVLSEYKEATKASANPSDILSHIINTFGMYPTKQESVGKIIKSLLETEK